MQVREGLVFRLGPSRAIPHGYCIETLAPKLALIALFGPCTGMTRKGSLPVGLPLCAHFLIHQVITLVVRFLRGVSSPLGTLRSTGPPGYHPSDDSPSRGF